MGCGLSQWHLQNTLIYSECLWRHMYLSSVPPEYFCPANKECLPNPAAQQESSLPWQWHELFCLPYKFQISRICVGVLTSCFSSWSLFPLFLCCLSLISVSLLPCASSNTRHGTISQHWNHALEEFLSSAPHSFMQYNWASISNPLPHSLFPNLLVRLPQCWPGMVFRDSRSILLLKNIHLRNF